MRRIRTRLIVAFLAVTILPAIPLSYVVRNLLSRSFAPPVFREIEQSLDDGLVESRERLHQEKDRFESDIRERWLPIVAGIGPIRAGGVAKGRSELGRVGRDGRSSSSIAPPSDLVDELGGDLVLPLPLESERAAHPELAAWSARKDAPADDTGPTEPERVDEWLASVSTTNGQSWLFARPLPPGMATRAERIGKTLALVRAFRDERAAVLQGYVVPFVLSYALLLIVAVAVGAALAARVARPVEALAEGARRVGSGNLDTRVAVPASGEVGDLVRAFNGMVESLTHQRSELARLERVAAWRDLARSLAHEIKNPLMPIQLAVQQLADRYPGQGEKDTEYSALLTDCAEIVNEEVESLRKLVREFAEFARLPEPAPARGDLAATLGEIARLYGDDRITLDVGPAELPARFDEGELRRALINLVDNGLAACRTAGRAERVEIDAEREERGTVVRVTDHGTGIRAGDLERVFEPNFSTKTDGMGLGLAIVEGIVRGHGGTIDVASEEGQSTTFTIRLPGGDESTERSVPGVGPERTREEDA